MGGGGNKGGQNHSPLGDKVFVFLKKRLSPLTFAASSGSNTIKLINSSFEMKIWYHEVGLKYPVL